MIRRYGTPALPGQHYRRRAGAYGVFLRGGLLLLTHQAGPVPEYQLPGGGIDPGEGAIAALHREAREETGWTISTPMHLGSYRRFCFMPDYDMFAEKLCGIWLARPVLSLGFPTEPGHSAHWMTPAKAIDALRDPGSRAFVLALMRQGILPGG